MNRRQFLKLTAVSGASVILPAHKIIGSNDNIHVAIIGLRNKGAHHIYLFGQIPGVRIIALCDPDQEILQREVQKFEGRNEKVKAYKDIRKLLDNKDVDAIVIASPNHWHALMAIWGCQAGKDVYVEKPVSHNVWEGRKIVEAARKYKRIVQAGTQSRSDEALHEVFDYINQGNIGAIKVVHGLCYKPRNSIGKVDGIQPIPDSIDYDLWTGPAPMQPLMRQSLHYDWHWLWTTGNGDIGNQGPHEMDMSRWILNKDKLPERVMSIGGRFGYIDDGETANTQIAVYDYKPVPIIFEVRGLPCKKNSRAMDNYKGVRIGIIVKCEGGYFAGGAGGGWIYDNYGVKIKQFSSSGGENHHMNFINAVRSRKVEDLNADILEGHLSSALCHIGNISHRLGTLTPPNEIRESIKMMPNVSDTFERFADHLFSNWVDISVDKAVLGPWLELDVEKEKFKTESEFDLGYWANKLVREEYREPFVVTEKI